MTMESPTRRRLSTGQEVALPLELSFAVGGVVVPARRRALRAVLPDPLTPLPIAPGIGCVALVGIQYHRVGGAGGDALEPYDEFAVIVPALADAEQRDAPVTARLLGGQVGGYVHWLPVTTDASVALGREIWGYPKERADVTVTDGPDGIRTVVRSDAGRICTLDVPRARGRERAVSLSSYTTKDERLLSTSTEIEGPLAIRSGIGASVDLGSAADAGPLTELGFRPRPLVRIYGSRVRARLGAGESIGPAVED